MYMVIHLFNDHFHVVTEEPVNKDFFFFKELYTAGCQFNAVPVIKNFVLI